MCEISISYSENLGNIALFYIGSDKAGFYIKDDASAGLTNYQIMTNSTFQDNTKYHVTFVYDATDGIHMYVNGAKQSTYIFAGDPSGGMWFNNILLANRVSIQALRRTTTSYRNGTIDELSIFDYQLTQAQVTRLYNKSIDITTETAETQYSNAVTLMRPVAYWRLGEADTSGTAVDETGNYDGTYVGTPVSVAGLLVDDADTAVSFNGTNQYCNTAIYNSANKVSVSFSVTCDSTLAKQMFFGEMPSAGGVVNSRVRLGVNDATSWYFAIGNGTTTYINETTPHNLINGVTYHVVYTIDSTFINIYLDGVNVVSVTSSVALGTASTNPWTIGRLGDYNGQYFDGTLDEVTIFDYPLSQSQVAHLYKTAQATNVQVLSQQCKVEIDRWDLANSQAQLYVRLPYISKDKDTIANISFDSTNADNSDNIGWTGDIPAQLVWSEYGAVYHLSSDGSDSAANSLDGTLQGGIDATNIVDFGIGKGMTFDGLGELVDVGDVLDLRTNDLMLSVTFSMDALDATNITSIYAKSAYGALRGRYYIAVLTDNIVQFTIDVLDPSALHLQSVSTIQALTEYTIDITVDRSGVMSMYMNGIFEASIDVSGYLAVDYNISCF